jgi:hypothetical protein
MNRIQGKVLKVLNSYVAFFFFPERKIIFEEFDD